MTSQKVLDLKAEIDSEFGAGTVKIASDPSFVVEYLPTGVLPFDFLLGGGLPRGRIIEVFGDFSTLKSWIALRAIAACQRAGLVCALVDTEHAFDRTWAIEQGVDVDALIVQQPPHGEEAVGVTEYLIRREVDLIVWDSVAATIPKTYQEAKPGEDIQPARLAVLMSNGLRRLNTANSRTAILCINQVRMDIGITFGSKVTTPGGKALGFYASQRIRLQRAGKITEDVKVWDGEKMVGAKQVNAHKIKAVMEKSKLNAPDREVWFTFDLRNAEADIPGFVMAQGMEHGFIAQNGAMYTLEGHPAVRGKEKFKEWLATTEVLTEAMGKLVEFFPGDPD